MATIIGLQQLAPPALAPMEAVSVAKHYVGALESVGKTRLRSVSLDRGGWGRGTDAGTYNVSLRPVGKDYDIFVVVDAQSGDVTFLSIPRPVQPPSRGGEVAWGLTNNWLWNIGRLREFSETPVPGTYNAVERGLPIFNIRAYVNVFQHTIVGYSGFGKLPPPPNESPRLSQAEVLPLAKKQLRAIPGSRDDDEIRLTPGLFYDAKQQRTRNAWRAVEGVILQGTFYPSFTVYVDAVDGSAIPEDLSDQFAWRYKSRDSRAGLKDIQVEADDEPLFESAKEILRVLCRTDVSFDVQNFEDGRLHLSTNATADLLIGEDGALIHFSGPTAKGRLEEGVAVKRAQDLTRKTHYYLPEGRWSVENSLYQDFTRASYQQWAYGYPYLGNPIVNIELNDKGQVAKYDFAMSLPTPTLLPKKLLPVFEVERIAVELEAPFLPKDSPGIHHFASARSLDLGWFPTGDGHLRLTYLVIVMVEQTTKSGTRGGGTSYHFDAETGKCLDPFPYRSPVPGQG